MLIKVAPARSSSINWLERLQVIKVELSFDYDLSYLKDWALWLALNILSKTPFTLLNKDIY